MAPPEVKFMENRLGGVALVINGCKYRINRRSGGTVYWRCFFRWCRANAVVEDGKLKSSGGKHICPQPLQQGNGKGGGGRQQSTPEGSLQTPQRKAAAASSLHPAPSPAAPHSSSSAAPAGAVSGAKMATRAAQGPAGKTNTSNGQQRNVAKVLRSQQQSSNATGNNKQKPAGTQQQQVTNNNMVVRRKSKAETTPAEPLDVKSGLTPSESNESLSEIGKSDEGSPSSVTKQVHIFFILA